MDNVLKIKLKQKLSFATVFLIGIFSFTSISAQIVLTRSGKPKAAIVVSDGADFNTNLASNELQKYIGMMSGVRLPIQCSGSANKGRTIIYVGKNFLSKERLSLLNSDKMEDAFMVVTQEKAVYLAGKNSIGDLYAVYTLLEEYMGCMKFNDKEEYVPRSKTITLPKVERMFSPAFPFRVPAFPDRLDESYAHWHKISNFSDWGMFVHTFEKLVPPNVYFDEHPDYFAMVDGMRKREGQLCLSNPELMDVLRENLRVEIEAKHWATYWSVSQNDCYNYCECDQCLEKYKKYGAISGAYIEMANELARHFPDKQISTLAYQFTRQAPKGIKLLPNVNVMFCSIECNRSMPLEKDHRSFAFVKDMRDWTLLTNNLFVWDYVVQFNNFLTPFPNFDVLQPNIKFFLKNGIRMMFQQGSGLNWSDMGELKQYLIAKLLWNPDIDVDSLTSHFFSEYYGVAAPYVKRCFDTLHAEINKVKETQWLDIYGYPVYYKDAFLTPALLLFYEQQMDLAEKIAKKSGNSNLLQRVQRARTPYDFSLIDISLNDVTAWVLEDGTINPTMLKRLDNFMERCKNGNVQHINERDYSVNEYYEYVHERLDRMVSPNLLDSAGFVVTTAHSPLYPVGGDSALNDRHIGGLDFRFNWLGFQGEDMVVEVDFGKGQTVSKVSMNFLKMVGSWVFLPELVKVMVSDDGENWDVVSTIKGDTEDRDYLAKSVPFNFNLPEIKARYLKVHAVNMGICPEWHRGYGQPAWIFVDELIVN